MFNIYHKKPNSTHLFVSSFVQMMMPLEETGAEPVAVETEATMAVKKLQRMEQRSRESTMYESMGVMTDIVATHLQSNVYVDVKSLLQIVADILNRTNLHGAEVEQLELDISAYTINDNMLKQLAYDIRQIRNEILCYYIESDDPRELEVAQTLFRAVSAYPWEAKVVIILAAFAVNYGDDWLTSQLYTTNSLARSITFLKQLPVHNSSNNTGVIQLLDGITDLIKAILSMIQTIIEFSELPSEYITVDNSTSMSLAVTLIYSAIYWTVRGVMVCASKFNSLLLPERDEHKMESWKYSIPPLDKKIEKMHRVLKREINNCHQEIEKKKQVQAYDTLVQIFRTTQAYNTRVLKALMCSKNDVPLVEGSTKKRVGVEVLKQKTVLLLISDLHITQEEILVLEQIYNDIHLGKSERPYEMVWLPVLDGMPNNNTMEQESTFSSLQSSMPWYSLYHPSMLEHGSIKYIKQQWHFDKKPIIVVLDPQGKVTCVNAIHMMWIWGISAFPFTRMREEKLWNEEKWTIEFVVDGIDPTILNWIREEKSVCLYGGEDINWIRTFTSTMRNVAQEAKIPLEMIYLGKSNPKEQVKKNIDTITKERLSHCWQDVMSIWFFWERLESMWYSKMQYNRTIDNDPIMREITKMLTFDGSNDGWAIIGKGTREMATAHGNKMIDVLTKFNEWKTSIESHGFIQALINALSLYSHPQHCSCLVLPRTQGMNNELSCAECGRQMERYILYQCRNG